MEEIAVREVFRRFNKNETAIKIACGDIFVNLESITKHSYAEVKSTKDPVQCYKKNANLSVSKKHLVELKDWTLTDPVLKGYWSDDKGPVMYNILITGAKEGITVKAGKENRQIFLKIEGYYKETEDNMVEERIVMEKNVLKRLDSTEDTIRYKKNIIEQKYQTISEPLKRFLKYACVKCAACSNERHVQRHFQLEHQGSVSEEITEEQWSFIQRLDFKALQITERELEDVKPSLDVLQRAFKKYTSNGVLEEDLNTWNSMLDKHGRVLKLHTIMHTLSKGDRMKTSSLY